MNSRKLVCLSIALVAILAFGAWVRAQYRPQYNTPALTLPVYAAGLAPEREDAPPEPSADIARLEAKIDKLQATVDRILKLAEDEAAAPGPAPSRGAAQPNQAALNSAATKCATCHAPQTAKDKGDGFVMFAETPNGLNFAPLGVAAQKRIVTKVQTGEMPKPPATLTADEKAALVAAFSGK